MASLATRATATSKTLHLVNGGGIFAPRTFHRRTRMRFASNRRRELIRHLGREPSYPERLIIERIIAVEWELRRLDAKVDMGEELSGHALRARLAAENRLRLDLVALGLGRPTTDPPSPIESLKRHLGGKR